MIRQLSADDSLCNLATAHRAALPFSCHRPSLAHSDANCHSLPLQAVRHRHPDQPPLRDPTRHRGRARVRRQGRAASESIGSGRPAMLVRLRRWLFGVTPKRTSSALRGWLDRIRKRSSRWRGHHRQHARRARSPECRPRRKACADY